MEKTKNWVNYGAPEPGSGPGHYVFYGNPGTGKTEVARLMGKIFHALGLLQTDHFDEIGREDIVAAFVGQSALKIKKRLDNAMGGVLFLDEAYALTKNEGGANTFGNESYDTMMRYIDNNRDNICVIFAGYTKEMKDFINANPGMGSKIPESNRIEFPDYTEDELLKILLKMIQESNYRTDSTFIDKAIEKIHAMVNKNKPDFGNARAMRTLLENVKKNCANRISKQIESGEEVSEEVRLTLTGADIVL